jgi:hypothetical protein
LKPLLVQFPKPLIYLVASPEAPLVLENNGRICPYDQRSPSVESEEFEDAEDLETVATYLKAVTNKYMSTALRSSVPVKTTRYNIQGYSASFYQAVDYCTYVPQQTRRGGSAN